MLHYTHIAYVVIFGMALLYVFASVCQGLQLSCSWHWSCRMSKYVFLFLSLLCKVWGGVFLGKLYNHSAWQEIIIVWILLVHCCVHGSPPLIRILTQLNILLIFVSVLLISTSVFSYLHLYVQGGVLPLSFGLKFCVFSHLTLSHAICFAYINLDIQWRAWLMQLLFMYFHFTSLLLNSQIFSHLFSNFLSCWWPQFGVGAWVLHPHKITGEMLLYILI
jgi:hypothetical protein